MFFSGIMGVVFLLGVVFLAKMVSNILDVSKIILVQRNKKFLASLALAASAFISYLVTKAIVREEGIVTTVIASLACGVGCYVAMSISDKLSRDRLYMSKAMSDNREAMTRLRDFLMNNHITNDAHECFTKEWEKTIAITIYANTKAKKDQVRKYIENCGDKIKFVEIE